MQRISGPGRKNVSFPEHERMESFGTMFVHVLYFQFTQKCFIDDALRMVQSHFFELDFSQYLSETVSPFSLGVGPTSVRDSTKYQFSTKKLIDV